MKTKIILASVFVLLFLMVSVKAQKEIIDINQLKTVAVPVHILELILALFICFKALKFFRITKPINLFLFLYTSIGFFIISSLLYLFLYFSIKIPLEVNFVSVYIGSRVALMGMLISFVIFFYQWNKIMRKTNIK